MIAAEQDSRRVVRMAVVQEISQMELGGASTAEVIAEFDAGKLPRESEAIFAGVEGDSGLFKLLIDGAVSRQTIIDRAIARHLGKNWRLDRLDAVARAILRAGVTELERCADTPAAVVIDEYIEIAKGFLDAAEIGFINATLDACAKDLRA
jgi:transcription antitermination protein NusB